MDSSVNNKLRLSAHQVSSQLQHKQILLALPRVPGLSRACQLVAMSAI